MTLIPILKLRSEFSGSVSKFEFRTLDSFFRQPKTPSDHSSTRALSQTESLATSPVTRSLLSELEEGMETSDFHELFMKFVNALVVRTLSLNDPQQNINLFKNSV
jgi:hypothetical protein